MKKIRIIFVFLGLCIVNLLLSAQAFNTKEKLSKSSAIPFQILAPKSDYSATHRLKLQNLYRTSKYQPVSNGHLSPHIKPVSPRSFNQLPINNIVLVGTRKERQKLKRWLHDIAVVPVGYRTLKRIEASGHILTLKHSGAARLSSGRTIAPMTRDLINGKGADVTIIFDAKMSDSGSHRVFSAKSELIEFNAQQNLFHELAHAMHQMQGTWRYFDSEGQAIEEENKFRIDLAEINKAKANLRYFTKGVHISKVGLGGIGYPLNE